MIRRNQTRRNKSGSIACRRLKILLVSDKTGYSPLVLDMIREDILQVIRRYADFCSDDIDIRVIQGDKIRCCLTIILKTLISD